MGRLKNFLGIDQSKLIVDKGTDESSSDGVKPIEEASEEFSVVRLTSLDFYTVENYGALMSVNYSACEQTKCRSMASLPVTIVRNGAEFERLNNHPIAKLLNGMPNEAMTASDLFSWHRLRCDTFGTAYWRIEWFKGQVVAIWPVTCQVNKSFDIKRPRGKRLMYQLTGDKYNPAGNYYSDEVIAIKTHVNEKISEGESLARLAAQEIGLSIDLERFYESMLKNGNHHLGHVEVPDKHMQEAQRQDLERAIDAKSGVSNAGKAPIFAAGAKWVQDGQTMKDASVIEQQQWVLKQICRATNVAPWKVYETDGVAYQGGQQANIDYVTDTVLPDARMIEQAFIPVLQSMGDGDCELKMNLKGLMRGDDASRSQYYREMVYMGAYTPKRVCELEDEDPRNALDTTYFPLNYGAVDEDGNVTVYSQNQKEPADGNQTGTTD